MSRRISLGKIEFASLVRGETVHQGGVEIDLYDISFSNMFAAISNAIESGARPLNAFVLQEDLEEIRRWIHGINSGEPKPAGDFLLTFASAVCRADATNYPLLRPAILALKSKFPDYRFEGEL